MNNYKLFTSKIMTKQTKRWKQIMKGFALSTAVLSLFFACSKPLVEQNAAETQRLKASSNGAIDTTLSNLTFVTNPVNLNIIMFVPTDNPALPNYKTRLSQLFVHFQDWLHNEMGRYGYSSYLGLAKDSAGLVNIIEIPAAGTQADYPYSSAVSAGKIINEINTYRAAHPSQFSSNNHYLVLLPARTDGDNSQPFYGYGKYCFAVDNSSMSVNGIPNPSSNYLGGMLHELGHGLNLPHNRAKYVSEEPTLGTSLMGSGNVSFSKGQPTFLTGSDAAILNRNEVFQPAVATASPYQAPTYSVQPQFAIDNSQQKIFITGNYTSNLPISEILVYMDPNVNNEGTGANKDYNAVTWKFAPVSSGVIQGTIDLNELYYKGNTPYELKVKLLLQNGYTTSNVYEFNYVNGLMTTNQDSVYTYSNASYAGVKGSFGKGQYTTADLLAKGVTDNSVSSIKVGANVKVTLYNGNNFTGDSLVVTSSSTYLSTFNDKVSSMKVQNR